MNVFDNYAGAEHRVAESSKLKATIVGGIADIEIVTTNGVDNGTIISLGENVEGNLYKEAAYTAGTSIAKPYLVLTPPLAYGNRTAQKAEKYFYNAKGEIARAYELYVDDIFAVSGVTATKGTNVDADYAAIDADDAATHVGFMGEVVGKLGNGNTLIRVVKL